MRIFETLQERNALFILGCRSSRLFILLIVFVLFYICQLSCVYVWIFIRFLVHEYPQSHPDETQSADNDKSHFPAVAHAHALEVAGQGRDTQWGYQCSDGRAGIEYGSGEGTVFLWKIFGSHLDGGRKVSCFTDAQYDTGGNEVVNAGDGYGRGQCTGSANHVGGIFNAEGHFCGKSAEGVHTSTDRPYGNGP